MDATEVLITSEQIEEKVNLLASKIALDFKGRPFILVCVLNGAYIFAADLSRAIWNAGHTDFKMEFVGISSYGKRKKSSKKPTLTKGIETDMEGKDVVIVEDIIETGNTLKFLAAYLLKRNARSVKICALLSKQRKVTIEPDYLGFEVRVDAWVEGYGLDTGFLGRGRPEIIVRK